MDKETKYILKSTSKAMHDIASRWYADGYLPERDIQRLMLWEFKIDNLLNEGAPLEVKK